MDFVQNDDDQEDQELTNFEKMIMDEFQRNDEEIDEMIGVVSEQIAEIRGMNENIYEASKKQETSIKQTNKRAEQAREGLKQRSSDLE